MRFLMLTFGIPAALVLTGLPAAAQNYPWCTAISFGGINCGFTTNEQCMAALSGSGGFCSRNTQYVPTSRSPATHRRLVPD